MMIMLKLFLLLISFSTFAQEEGLQSPQALSIEESLEKKVLEIRQLDIEKFNDKIAKIEESFAEITGKKKALCNGQFSTIIFDQDGNEKRKILRLSREERKVCYLELKRLQVRVVEETYDLRKRYLDHLHSQRIMALNELRQRAIGQIQNVKDNTRRSIRSNKN